MKARVALFVASIALASLAATAPAASAFVYWANRGGAHGTTIGRANLDGSGANPSFIAGATGPVGVAVDSAHIYWANTFGSASTIGRANLDGSGVNQSFITGAHGPCGVAVDGAHIYWANNNTGTIGRANLDGSGADQTFITGADQPCGVAVDGSFVYWANEGSTTIGRANLDGSSPDESFITAASEPVGVAVNGSFVYWGNNGVGTIGRANLDGTAPTNSFITGSGSCTDFPVVSSTYIYWANDCAASIGRANLDGTGVEENFLGVGFNPGGVAVDALTQPPVTPPPPTGHPVPPPRARPHCTLHVKSGRVFAATLARATHRPPKKGVLQLSVRCSQAVHLTLGGTVTAVRGAKRHRHTRRFHIRAVHGFAATGKSLTLTVRLPKAALRALRAGWRESVVFALTATDANGSSTATARVARLRRATRRA